MKKRKVSFPVGKSEWCILFFLLLGLFFYFGISVFRFSAYIAFGLVLIIAAYRLLQLLAKRRPKAAKGLQLLLTVCLSLGLTAAAITGVFIARAGYGSSDVPCEYVIVLGAGVDGTTPSLSLQERLDAAYTYLTKHPDTICIVSGGQGGGEDITEAACMFAELTKRGIPAEQIWQEGAASNTRENLSNSLALIEARTGSRPKCAGIISSEYHLYRAGLLAREQGLESIGVPAKTHWLALRINYFLREIVAVWYYALLGG